MSTQINFTKQELKQLGTISSNDLSTLIEEKKYRKYIIVQKEMIKDIHS